MRVGKHAYMFQLTEGISLYPVLKDQNGHRDGGAGDSRKVKSRWFKRVKGKEGVKKSLLQVRQSTSRLTMLYLFELARETAWCTPVSAASGI